MTATDTDRPTFLLGLGAHKSGTTWLHGYLSARPDVDMGFMKEYHILDARSIAAGRGFRPTLRDHLGKFGLNLHGNLRAIKAIPDVLRKRPLYRDPEAYFDYFAGLLGAPGIRLTGDITPSYSGLPAGILRETRAGFERRGIRACATFQMRDPVERAWSALRMRRRGDHARRNDPVARLSDDAALRAVYGTDEYRMRGQYDATLATARAVFGDDLLTVFFEEMFAQAQIDRICAFLGLDPAPADFGEVRNTTKKSQHLSEDTMRAVARHYAPSYRAAAELTSPAHILGIWPSARFVLEP